MKTKKCTKCGVEKTLEEYNRDVSKSSGFRPDCKACVQKKRKEYISKNKQKIKQYNNDYYKKNKDFVKSKVKKYASKIKSQQPACIYKIINLKNNKIYIGETLQAQWRWKQHLRCLRGKRHENQMLQEDFNKFGEEAFEWSIIKEVDKNKDILLLEEIKTINSFLKQGKKLYNLSLTIEQLQMLQEEE